MQQQPGASKSPADPLPNPAMRVHALTLSTPQPLENPPKLDSLAPFSDPRIGTDKWPYGIEWLNDAYPIPYWVRQQQEKEAAENREEAATAGKA